MKLRNKKTGEISEVNFLPHGATLAELNAEWEDYEEPDEYWYMDSEGNVDSCMKFGDFDKPAIEIGNYFETKAEAEKAVEKLKAWKRLKDKGFRFKSWDTALSEIYFKVPDTFFIEDGGIVCLSQGTCEDLDLLFGGGE